MVPIKKEKILFVAHRASRTGAPMVLLHLLRWLRNNTDLQCDILFRGDGELEREITGAADNSYHWPRSHQAVSDERASATHTRGQRSSARLEASLLERLARSDYRLLYVNSVCCCDMLPRIWEALRCPTVVHVHELEGLIRLACGGYTMSNLVPMVSRFVAVSDKVGENLKLRHGVSAERISKIPAFVEASVQVTREAATIRNELGIPQDALLVGGSGTLGFRKGTDLFIQVARKVSTMTPRRIAYAWVGGGRTKRELIEFQTDLEKIGLEGIVHFTGTRSNPQDYFNAFDLFLMTSREDPFPLVCLENARAGNPILCFDHGSGCTEYVDETSGHVSPYQDVDDMAAALVGFATDPGRLRRASEVIRGRLAPYTVESCAPRILSVINGLMEDPQ